MKRVTVSTRIRTDLTLAPEAVGELVDRIIGLTGGKELAADLSGALLRHEGGFFFIAEGPEEVLDLVFARLLAADELRDTVLVLEEERVAARRFDNFRPYKDLTPGGGPADREKGDIATGNMGQPLATKTTPPSGTEARDDVFWSDLSASLAGSLPLLQSYIPAAALDLIRRGEDPSRKRPERRERVMMVARILFFQELFTKFGDDTLADLVTRFSETTTYFLTQAGAEIHQYLGDRVVASLPPKKIGTAVSTGEQMAVGLAGVLAGADAPSGLAHLRIGIGIARGAVLYGNFGSPLRNTFNALGEASERAQLLARRAIPREGKIRILIDDNAWETYRERGGAREGTKAGHYRLHRDEPKWVAYTLAGEQNPESLS